jgi:hypothetical protein
MAISAARSSGLILDGSAQTNAKPGGAGFTSTIDRTLFGLAAACMIESSPPIELPVNVTGSPTT